MSSTAIIGVVAAGAGPARAGGYVFTPIVGTLTGINESDTVVGAEHALGFIWRNGIKTVFGAPAGATFTGSGRINRYGIALAYDTLADGTAGSFTYNATNGATHQISVAGATSVNARSISNGGSIAGSVTTPGSTVAHSFSIQHGVTTIFDPPGAVGSYANFVGPDGTVSGAFYVADPKVSSGYVYKDGVFTILNWPSGRPFEGYAQNSAGYVSPHGVVLGDFNAEIEQTGFVYKDGAYSVLTQSSAWLRVLKDGTLFGFLYGTNDHVLAIGPHAHGYLFPPGVFTNLPFDVNENGDFIGYITTMTQEYETIIATCPAGQAPCY